MVEKKKKSNDDAPKQLREMIKSLMQSYGRGKWTQRK